MWTSCSGTSMHDDTAVLKEIRSAFSNISDDDRGMWSLDSMGPTESYFLCLGGEYGVAVSLDNLPPVDKTFSDVRFAVRDFVTVGTGEVKTCLSLTSPMPQSQYGDKFVLLCYDFLMWVSSGVDVSEDPFVWWEDWKRMVGNADRDRRTYPVIAEMITLDMMQSDGLNPTWEGPAAGTVDIRSDVYDCEVKSSLSRYNDEITISSALQLKRTDRDLHLRYICFEQSESGLSVDDMVDRLVSRGMDPGDIEDNLDRLGLHRGNHSRTVRYAPVRIWDLVVDDGFPYIDENSFVSGHLPYGVKRFEYTLSLTELDPKPLDYPLR